MAVTLTQICEAIADALGAATGIARHQAPSELTEGIEDLPLIQVYPDSGVQDATGKTDRTSFGGDVRETDIVVFADLYSSVRHEIGEDMTSLLTYTDACVTVLEAQKTKPYFGLVGIKAFRWVFRRIIFIYGDPRVPFVGTRFTLTIRTF